MKDFETAVGFRVRVRDMSPNPNPDPNPNPNPNPTLTLTLIIRCVFPDHGLGLEGLQEACKGAKLYLRYKRFVFDSKKKMVQD